MKIKKKTQQHAEERTLAFKLDWNSSSANTSYAIFGEAVFTCVDGYQTNLLPKIFIQDKHNNKPTLSSWPHAGEI